MNEYRDVMERLNAQAALLAAEGRERKFKNEKDATRKGSDEDQVRYAFWRLSEKNTTQAGRDTTDEAALAEAFSQCIGHGRRDERHRIALAVAAGLRAMLGEEADSLMADLADAMGLHEGCD